MSGGDYMTTRTALVNAKIELSNLIRRADETAVNQKKKLRIRTRKSLKRRNFSGYR